MQVFEDIYIKVWFIINLKMKEFNISDWLKWCIDTYYNFEILYYYLGKLLLSEWSILDSLS